MRIVTPEEFKAAWTAIANLHRMDTALLANWAWNYAKPAPKPRLPGGIPPAGMVSNDDLTRCAERVVLDVARALHLAVTYQVPVPEGQDLDALLFNDSAADARAPVVALEHEGHIVNTHAQEIPSLRRYAAPLKVLITYARPPRPRAGEEQVADWLRSYAAAYQSGPVAAPSEAKLLVVFGMPDGRWEFYKYEKDAPNGFVKLP